MRAIYSLVADCAECRSCMSLCQPLNTTWNVIYCSYLLLRCRSAEAFDVGCLMPVNEQFQEAPGFVTGVVYILSSFSG